jgi:hypothetical protein
MQTATLHNPDRYMGDLRQIISQGRKRIGLLIGAGAPTAIKIDGDGSIATEGSPLIPNVEGLTDSVVKSLSRPDRKVVTQLKKELGGAPNIELILTRARRLSEAIGTSKIFGVDGDGYGALAGRICDHIGNIVKAKLPREPNPYSELVSWIAGTHREHAVEIFTPNYDLLLEEAFERVRVAYFDGFTGAHHPFFDPVSVAMCDELPPRWSRLWKLHGSLGWKISDDVVIRTGNRNATELIYPDHLKYDQVTRLPYSALFERLRAFLSTPDSLLICSGFSFFDSHICSVIEESLAANAHTAVLAFQFQSLEHESLATQLAFRRPNISVYGRDGAVVNGVEGLWQPGELPNDQWQEIRQTFWNSGSSEFLLGDFTNLARFFALAHTQQLLPGVEETSEDSRSPVSEDHEAKDGDEDES